MKIQRLRIDDAVGCYLMHMVQAGDVFLKKGKKLVRSDIAIMHLAGIDEVDIAKLDSDELDENDAVEMIAAHMPVNFQKTHAKAGRINFFASSHGLFKVDKIFVDCFNAIDYSVTLATILPDTPVSKGDMVASLKIIPFGVRRVIIEAVCQLLSSADLMQFLPFKPYDISLFLSVLPTTKVTVLDKINFTLKKRLIASNSCLVNTCKVQHNSNDLAQALKKQVEQIQPGSNIFIIYGASSVSDENDVLPAAIRQAGGEVIRVGMPVEPGNLLVLGVIDGITIIGAPGCARSPLYNGFDIVLNQLLVGTPISLVQIEKMGVGGLLNAQQLKTEMALDKSGDDIKIAAIVLAAGRSSRVNELDRHKLLQSFHGETLIHKVVDSAIKSECAEVLVITGHNHEEIEKALSDLDAKTIFNADYREGMASSIVSGVRAIDTVKTDAIMILLGDMPDVTQEVIDQLIANFRAHQGQAIIRAVFHGKKGNPVIFPVSLKHELLLLQGDVGARSLIEKNLDYVIDVEIGEAAILDLDTSEAIQNYRNKLITKY